MLENANPWAFADRRIDLRIVIAPDSYKGSLSALGVAQAMERGILSVFPDADVCKIPMADGGEGTVDALLAATVMTTGGKIHTLNVKHFPMPDLLVERAW